MSRRLVVGLVIAAMNYSWPGRWGRGGCFVYWSLAVLAKKLMLVMIELESGMTSVDLTLRSRSTVLSALGLHFVRLPLEKRAFLDGLRWRRGRIGILGLGGTGRWRGCGRAARRPGRLLTMDCLLAVGRGGTAQLRD